MLIHRQASGGCTSGVSSGHSVPHSRMGMVLCRGTRTAARQCAFFRWAHSDPTAQPQQLPCLSRFGRPVIEDDDWEAGVGRRRECRQLTPGERRQEAGVGSPSACHEAAASGRTAQVQAGSPRKNSRLAGPLMSQNGRPIKKLLPEAIEADFLLAQESHLPKDAVTTEESWMRSQRWRACILSVAAAWRVGDKQEDGSQGG